MTEKEELIELIAHYPLATVITVVSEKPVISYIPLVTAKTTASFELVGHLARGNPHWRGLTGGLTTVLFQGPHAYITPLWYHEHDVPTWNYVVARLEGKVELIESRQGIVDCLVLLSRQVESVWPSGWKFSIPDDLEGENLEKSIVGFRFVPKTVSLKKKLSQKRSVADRAGVMRGLEARKDDGSHGLRAEMMKLFKADGTEKG